MVEKINIYLDKKYIGEIKNFKEIPNTINGNKLLKIERINDEIKIDFSKEFIDKIQEMFQKLVKIIKSIIKTLWQTIKNNKILQKIAKVKDPKEIKKFIKSLENKDKLKQSWKYNSYRNKLNFRILDKRGICCNCRSNLQ